MSPKEYLPKPGKKVRDMDRRPVPMHIDDLDHDENPDEKWVPGNRKKVVKPKANQEENETSKKNTQEMVESSFDLLHLLLIAVIGFGAIAGIIFIAGAVAQVYGIDLAGQIGTLWGDIWEQGRGYLDPILGPA